MVHENFLGLTWFKIYVPIAVSLKLHYVYVKVVSKHSSPQLQACVLIAIRIIFIRSKGHVKSELFFGGSGVNGGSRSTVCMEGTDSQGRIDWVMLRDVVIEQEVKDMLNGQ